MSKIARRQFIQLSAVAAAGCFVARGQEARAQDLPKVDPNDTQAKNLRYVHDASTIDPATRSNPAENQLCSNCALYTGEDGAEWGPCQIFPGKAVAADGWCSVWAPKG